MEAPGLLGWLQLLGSVQGVLLLGTLLVFIYGLHPVARWRYSHIPGPRPWWLVGNVGTLLSMGSHQAYAYWADKYGPVYKFFQGPSPIIVVSSPELVHKVSLRMPHRHPFPSLTRGEEKQFDDAGMLLARGEYLRSLRAAWQPFFYNGSLEAYAGKMNESAGRLLDALALAAEVGEAIDIFRAYGAMTMDVVGSSGFGVDFCAQPGAPANPEAEAIKHAAQVIFTNAGPRSSVYALLAVLLPPLAPAIRLLAQALPDKGWAEVLEARRVVKSTVARLLDQARKESRPLAVNGAANGKPALHQQNDAENEDPNSVLAAPDTNIDSPPVNSLQDAAPKRARKGIQPGSFMHLIKDATNRATNSKLTDVEVAAQAFTFLLAGYETTASALAFATYLLATNPDKEAAMVAEVDKFGRDREPTFDDLAQFPYVEAVLKEALRMYPPGALTIREAKEAIDVGGYHIPKGAWIHCSVYAMQNSAKYWDQPERFLPARYLPGTPEAAAVKPYAWAAFGDGTRSCIGFRFAMEEAKIALIRLYQRYQLRLTPGQVPLRTINRITLSPVGGIKVTVHPRA